MCQHLASLSILIFIAKSKVGTQGLELGHWVLTGTWVCPLSHSSLSSLSLSRTDKKAQGCSWSCCSEVSLALTSSEEWAMGSRVCTWSHLAWTWIPALLLCDLGQVTQSPWTQVPYLSDKDADRASPTGMLCRARKSNHRMLSPLAIK